MLYHLCTRTSKCNDSKNIVTENGIETICELDDVRCMWRGKYVEKLEDKILREKLEREKSK